MVIISGLHGVINSSMPLAYVSLTGKPCSIVGRLARKRVVLKKAEHLIRKIFFISVLMKASVSLSTESRLRQ